jgi:hypothetical protein
MFTADEDKKLKKLYHDKMVLNLEYIQEATTGELFELDYYIQKELHRRRGIEVKK